MGLLPLSEKRSKRVNIAHETLNALVSAGLPTENLFSFACDGAKNLSCLPQRWLDQLDPQLNLYADDYDFPDSVVKSSNPVYQVHCANHVLNLINMRLTDNMCAADESIAETLQNAFKVLTFAKVSTICNGFLRTLGYPRARSHNKTRWWASFLCAKNYLLIAEPLRQLQILSESPLPNAPELLNDDELKALFNWVCSAEPCFILNNELQNVCRIDVVISILTFLATKPHRQILVFITEDYGFLEDSHQFVYFPGTS